MDGAHLDWSCAYEKKARILQNKTVWAIAVKMPPEAWYERYVKPWHSELARHAARVGMCVKLCFVPRHFCFLL